MKMMFNLMTHNHTLTLTEIVNYLSSSLSCSAFPQLDIRRLHAIRKQQQKQLVVPEHKFPKYLANYKIRNHLTINTNGTP